MKSDIDKPMDSVITLRRFSFITPSISWSTSHLKRPPHPLKISLIFLFKTKTWNFAGWFVEPSHSFNSTVKRQEKFGYPWPILWIVNRNAPVGAQHHHNKNPIYKTKRTAFSKVVFGLCGACTSFYYEPKPNEWFHVIILSFRNHNTYIYKRLFRDAPGRRWIYINR